MVFKSRTETLVNKKLYSRELFQNGKEKKAMNAKHQEEVLPHMPNCLTRVPIQVTRVQGLSLDEK